MEMLHPSGPYSVSTQTKSVMSDGTLKYTVFYSLPLAVIISLFKGVQKRVEFPSRRRDN